MKIVYYVIFLNVLSVTHLISTELKLDEKKSYSLNCISFGNNKEFFLPSNNGGVSVIYDDRIYYYWSEGIELIPLRINKSKNSIETEWIFLKKGLFYYHYSMNYVIYNDKIEIIAKDLGRVERSDLLPQGYADLHSFYLDRCENAINPVILGVPYLTTFNLLYANDLFVSAYFDFNLTNASQIIPYNQIYDEKSVFYSQYALYNPLTNGTRNKLNEKIIIKVSDRIENVFPDIDNPVSKYIKESSSRIVFDDWMSFNNSRNTIKKLTDLNIRNLWHIVHVWQNKGYDVALPDVFPANQSYGGNEELIELSDYDRSLGNLFSVHENYIDIFTESERFDKKYLALGPDGKFKFNWLQPYTLDTSYISKPTEIFNLSVSTSKIIHSTFKTNAAYHDVSTSYDPSKYVDYDHNTKNAGKLVEPYNVYRSLADTLRNIHQGPVSGEGLAHYLYTGYYDDICAQIHTAQSLPGSYGTEKLGGFYKPIFVDFNLKKLKEKAAVHGVGYYSRFFYQEGIPWGHTGYSRDSALMYSATELAYGNCAFISNGFYEMYEQSRIENDFVYPIQKFYATSKVTEILYNDNGSMLTSSEYIRKYPKTFSDFFDSKFMSQVLVKYSNGLLVYVNRSPYSNWLVKGSFKNGFSSYHAVIMGKDSLFCGNVSISQIELPKSNGWFCFINK